ncbi:MAG: DUF3822 family protein [Bacteroidales bacterium]|jgi:hypothetical protein|nr:DUF3822 family protein [Bacteroidales bacterium]MDD4703206.1 DUF3822 family protein [Bacteroidales bacterium]MDX9797388.1 DUF3822 family protein [Bacteroidales bacterium]
MDKFKLVNFAKSDDKIITQETDLCICIEKDGFTFSLISNYEVKALGEFTTNLNSDITSVMSNLRSCFNSIDIRLFNFANIRIIIQTSKNIFVPYKLYDNTKTKEYLRSVALISGSEVILESISDRLDIVSVFTIPMYLHSGIKILMPKAKFVSGQQVMAEYGFEISKLTGNSAVLLKRDKSCDLVIYKANQFTYSNTFNFSNENDLIYNIIFAFEQLGIDTEEITFLITGQEYTFEEKQSLRKYIKNVSYSNPMEDVRVGYELDGLNLQKYFLTLVK